MSELTFSCPSCGQHVQCEKAYGGHIIHCPNCVAEIRIPFSNVAIPTELSIPKAQLVTEPPAGTKPSVSPTPRAADANKEFICPVCKAELRAPTDASAQSETGLPMADLIRRTPEPDQKKEPVEKKESTPEDQPVSSEPAHHKTHTEHEQEIAAARAAQKIGLHPELKPRLSAIMPDTQPATADAPMHLEPGKDKKPESADDDHKSFHE